MFEYFVDKEPLAILGSKQSWYQLNIRLKYFTLTTCVDCYVALACYTVETFEFFRIGPLHQLYEGTRDIVPAVQMQKQMLPD